MKYKHSDNIIFYSEDYELPKTKMDFTAIVSSLSYIEKNTKAIYERCVFHVIWGGGNFNFSAVETEKNMINILLWIADELGKIPSKEIRKRFDYIFKNHLRKEIPNSNVFPLPLFTPLPNLPQKGEPILCRKYNAFFSGNLNKNRILLLWGLQGMPRLLAKGLYLVSCVKGFGRLFSMIYCGKQYDFSHKIDNSIIKFTDGFYHGFSPKEYAALTSRAKIVLNPRGFHSTECFRMYEAMAAGCVVISEKLPPLRIYKNIPIIQVNDWCSLYNKVRDILGDTEKMQSMSNRAYQYYCKNLSSEGIAQYIIETIAS